jgi:hypothetical protein
MSAELLIEGLIPVAAVIGAVGGSIASVWGIYEYTQGQIVKRKEILFELIKELETCNKIQLIRNILDRYVVTPEPNWRHLNEKKYYSVKNLSEILDEENDDPGAIEIKKRLDELLRFLSRIEYLLNIRVLKESETEYFNYLVLETMRNQAIIDFAQSDFPLYTKMRERITKEKWWNELQEKLQHDEASRQAK